MLSKSLELNELKHLYKNAARSQSLQSLLYAIA